MEEHDYTFFSLKLAKYRKPLFGSRRLAKKEKKKQENVEAN